MTLLDVLNGVRDGLTASLASSGQPRPGEVVRARIQPIPGNLDVSDVLQGDFDLTWVGKDVMFNDADLEESFAAGGLNAATIGGKPFTGATGIITGINGVPGILGQAKGKLPLPMQASFPVRVQVTWSVLDENGNPLAATEFRAPGGLEGADIGVVFAPEATELTSDVPPVPKQRFLRAVVTLSAGGVSTGPRRLPDLPVFVPALPIPTVLALFLHSNFQAREGDDDGATLIVVPEASPLRSLEQLQGVLNTLESAVSTLQGLGSFAAFLLGLGDLIRALSVQPHVQFRAADRINNLNDITLIQRGFFENDTEAEDELSSLILIGRPERGARCSNARDRGAGEGQFTVRTGPSMFVIVRDLDGKQPTAEGGSITIDREPPGGLFNPDRFNDEMSSTEFV